MWASADADAGRKLEKLGDETNLKNEGTFFSCLFFLLMIMHWFPLVAWFYSLVLRRDHFQSTHLSHRKPTEPEIIVGSGRTLSLLLLTYSARPCLGPA